MKTTFLNGDMKKKVYIKQPEESPSSEGKHFLCKLKKSIYDLKQASRHCNIKFYDVISPFGFIENVMDQCICQKVNGSISAFFFYVNHMLLATNDKGLLHETK